MTSLLGWAAVIWLGQSFFRMFISTFRANLRQQAERVREANEAKANRQLARKQASRSNTPHWSERAL